MDYDRLTHLLDGEDIAYAEIVTYHFPKDSDQLVVKTTTIDYYSDGDYQWSRTTRPIIVE